VREGYCEVNLNTLKVSMFAGRGSATSETGQAREHIVQNGESAWDVANFHGVSLEKLRAANRDNHKVAFDALVEGDAVQLPPECLNIGAILCCSVLLPCCTAQG
jgi:hypothetical protein